MYQVQQYRTLRFFAKACSSFGWFIIGFWALVGLLLAWKLVGFVLALLAGIAFGAGIGLPFVLSGQLISVSMEKKTLLEGIYEQGKSAASRVGA